MALSQVAVEIALIRAKHFVDIMEVIIRYLGKDDSSLDTNVLMKRYAGRIAVRTMRQAAKELSKALEKLEAEI